MQETKIQDTDDGASRSVSGSGNMGWVAKPSEGASGGMWCLWNTNKWRLISANVRAFSIFVLLEDLSTNKEFFFTNVYGPNSDSDRSDFWNELSSARNDYSAPWCVGGDFNVARRMAERKGRHGISSSMQRFSSWIDEMELVDL